MASQVASDLDAVVAELRACRACAAYLPLGPRPVFQVSATARLLITSQAPGTRAHESGTPFNDASGDRLRAWLALDREGFYDESRVAIMPIGFCYPGRDAKGGDRPPRPECAPLWQARLRASFAAVELTLLIGGYAIGHYLPGPRARSMTETIARWRDFLPQYFYELSKDSAGYLLFYGCCALVDHRLRPAPSLEAPGETFDIKDGANLTRVRLGEILAVTAAANYVEFVLCDQRRVLMRSTLAAIEEELGPRGFVRTHRSWLVNSGHVTALRSEGSGDYRIELPQLTVPLSRRFPAALAELRED